MNNNELSKFMCLILRHKPETIGITLDKHGWADVNELIAGVNNYYGKHVMDHETLTDIVTTDNKNRYSLSSDDDKIRCNQGHSIPVDVELKEEKPPAYLYHGTTAEAYYKIIQSGSISKMSRLYVHMQSSIINAEQSARRWGKTPVVLEIAVDEMYDNGYKFYLSENGVWLVDNVPIKYVRNIIELER